MLSCKWKASKWNNCVRSFLNSLLSLNDLDNCCELSWNSHPSSNNSYCFLFSQFPFFSSSVFKVDDERCASEAIGFYLNPRSDLSRRFRQLFVSWEVFFLPLLYLSVLLHQQLNFLQSYSPQNIVSQEMGEYAHTHSKLKCIRWIILFFFETPSQYLNFNTDKLR